MSALNAWTGRFPRLSRVTRPAAALLGLPVSTYTAALISNTSIPVWHEARGRLAFVFAGGAAASAGAAAIAATPVDSAGPARRLAVGGAVVELAAIRVMKRDLGELAEPYHEGKAGRYSTVGEALTVGLLRRLRESGARCCVLNHYGPTETTVGAVVNVLGAYSD